MCGTCKDGKCELLMKVLWKILCISCCPEESLLVTEED